LSDAHVTLHHVAAKAGVSVATASRALTGSKVSKANHDKVQKAALELGYVPNEAARSLRSVRTMTVGVVFNQINSALSTELLDALASTLEERGYSLFVSTAQGQEDRFDILVHRFLERRVDALLCVNAAGNGAALARYHAAKIPVAALFSKAGGYEALPHVGPSIVEAVTESVQRMKGLGHKRIAVLRPLRRSPPIESYRQVARKEGMTVRTYELQEGPLDAVACLNSLFSDQPPTLIVARQAEAVRLFEAADEMSILVPRMLSIVAIRDRTQLMPNTRLPLSMIHLNPAKVGREAAEMLLNRLAGGPEIAGETLVEMGSWIERGTTGPAPLQEVSLAG
jgi:DNA-binding LacI/PurR family transcriptional regulator